MTTKEKSLIELLLENETKVQKLYIMFANKFSSHKKFWMDIAKEEQHHMSALSKLKATMPSMQVVKETPYARKIIIYVEKFIKKEMLCSLYESYTIIDALNTALRLEQSMIERRCFDLFIPGNSDVEKVMKRLNRDTDRHAKSLKKELNRLLSGDTKKIS